MWFVVKRRGCCCNLSGGVALIVWFTTNWMCAKNNTILYVARASNSKRDCEHDLYCCLMPRCEALRTCRSGFPIATVVRIESIVGIWSFRQVVVKNVCLMLFFMKFDFIHLIRFRVDNAIVSQQVHMNLNMTVGQVACRILCRYTQSTLAASCVCWIVPIIACETDKRTCGCSCLKYT